MISRLILRKEVFA